MKKLSYENYRIPLDIFARAGCGPQAERGGANFKSIRYTEIFKRQTCTHTPFMHARNMQACTTYPLKIVSDPVAESE